MSGDASAVETPAPPQQDERPPLEAPDNSDVAQAAAALEAKFGGTDDKEADVDDAAPSEETEAPEAETAAEDQIPEEVEEAAAPEPGVDPRATAGETTDDVGGSEDPVDQTIKQLGASLAGLTTETTPAAGPATTAAPAPETKPEAPAAPAAPAKGVSLFSPEEISAMKGEYGEAIAEPLVKANERFGAVTGVLQQQAQVIDRIQRQQQARDVQSLKQALVWAKQQGLENVFGAPDAHFDTLPKHVQESRLKFIGAGFKAQRKMEDAGQFITSGDGFKAVVKETLLKKSSKGPSAPAARPAKPSAPASRSRTVPATAGPVRVRNESSEDADVRAASAAISKKFGIRA